MIFTMGFRDTASHLNEWNFMAKEGFGEMVTLRDASFAAASLITMQTCGVDLAQYYDVSLNCNYNGLMDLRIYESTPVRPVFGAFGRLHQVGRQLEKETGDAAQAENRTTVTEKLHRFWRCIF